MTNSIKVNTVSDYIFILGGRYEEKSFVVGETALRESLVELYDIDTDSIDFIVHDMYTKDINSIAFNYKKDAVDTTALIQKVPFYNEDDSDNIIDVIRTVVVADAHSGHTLARRISDMSNNICDITWLPSAPKEWSNGTGYFDNAVKSIGGEPGTVTVTKDSNNRLIVAVSTRFGAVVLFDRYSNGGNNVIVSNGPRMVENLFAGMLDSQVTETVAASMLGWVGCLNVGKRIEKLFK